MYVPFIQSLLFAQISPFVLIGIVGFVWALERGNSALSGLFTLLIAAKPHIAYAFWLLLLCFCIRHRKIRLLGSVAVFLIAPVLILFLYNPNILLGMVNALRGQPQFNWVTATPGISLRMVFGLNQTWLQVLPTVLGGLYVIFFYDYGDTFLWRSKLSPILLLSASTSFYFWPHDNIILLPAIIQILVWYRFKPESRWLPALLVLVNILEPLAPPWRCIYLAWWFPVSIALIYFIALSVDNRYKIYSKPTSLKTD